MKLKMWQWVALVFGAVVLYNLLQPKQTSQTAGAAVSFGSA